MLVYVESNFVLEIARAQQEAESAEQILRLAEEGKITLVILSFALSEPYANVELESVLRRRFLDSLEEQRKQLVRSASYQGLATSIAAVYPVGRNATLPLSNAQFTQLMLFGKALAVWPVRAGSASPTAELFTDDSFDDEVDTYIAAQRHREREEAAREARQ